MNKLIFVLIIFTYCNYIYGQSNISEMYDLIRERSMLDSIIFEKSQSILLDGGIQNLEKSNSDKSATGQLGYRSENIFGKFEIKFIVASSANEIQSDDITEYSSFILNPYTSESGLDAFNLSYFRRSFTRGGGFVNYLRYLFNKQVINSARFYNIIDNPEYELENGTSFINRFGYLLELNVSNFTWTNSFDTRKNGNIVALNPYLSYNYRSKFIDDVVEIIAGVGPAFRVIAGSAGNDSEFLKSIINTDKTNYLGAQFTAQAYIGGFYAKANYAIFGGDPKIDGLTGGEFFLSIGIQASIGSKSKEKVYIPDILDKKLMQAYNFRDKTPEIY